MTYYHIYDILIAKILFSYESIVQECTEKLLNIFIDHQIGFLTKLIITIMKRYNFGGIYCYVHYIKTKWMLQQSGLLINDENNILLLLSECLI